jgi:hypothetical protein
MRLHNNIVLYQGQLLANASTGTLTVTPARTNILLLLSYRNIISPAVLNRKECEERSNETESMGF